MAWISEALVMAQNEEVLLRDETDLPVNRIEGKYDNLEQYLGTHFRLLREDLTASYRNAIAELRRRKKHQCETAPITDVQVYKKVSLVRIRPGSAGVEYALGFGDIEGRSEDIEWNSAKYLMYNSLLCISCDGFQTFCWAVVSTRRARELNNERVIGVRPLEGFASFGDLRAWIEKGREYSMFESTSSYFEAYQHVLNVLRRKDIGKLEFLEHLVELKQNVERPEYLGVAEGYGEGSSSGWEIESFLGTGEDCWENGDSMGKSIESECRWDVCTEVSQGCCWEDSDKNFREKELIRIREESDEKGFQEGEKDWGETSLNRENETFQEMDSIWEGAQARGNVVGYQENHVAERENGYCNENAKAGIEIDQSQQDAIRHGLSKKLALIQGPAGTGKTFVGLQITKQLLSNPRVPTPLIVVCYTNRALDQFLEGVYKYEPCMVRLGTGSKSKVLGQCSSENFRKNFKIRTPNALRKLKGQLMTLQDELAEGLNFSADCMDAKLVSRKFLGRVARKEHLDGLFFCDACPADDIYEAWLSGKDKKHVSAFCLEASATTWTETESSEEEQPVEFHMLEDADDDPSIVASFLNSNEPGDVWNLTLPLRLMLHSHWLSEINSYGQNEFKKLAFRYDCVCQQIAELKLKIQRYVLGFAKVLGMTTTVAARNFDFLCSLKPAVMIVEEAAEVLEAQLLACLNPNIKHLILIGDHKQLRPSIATPHLASKHHLDVSMFERLIINGIEYKTLNFQRRMTPAVASLSKIFYPFVHDHRSVHELNKVRGVKQSVFFFDHSCAEQSADKSGSKINMGEAALVAQLALYMLNTCGYSSKDITILSMYRNQIHEISKTFHKHFPEESPVSGRKRKANNGDGDILKVRSVDEFQGEESDIIILSLVRNRASAEESSHLEHLPSTESIGFLGNTNRICVALTRARLGLFIFGNSELLSAKSMTWRTIIDQLSKNGWIGRRMKLCCPKHLQHEFRVQTVQDFSEAHCSHKCDSALQCGHPCPRNCHIGDHEDVICRMNCGKNLMCGHICFLRCHFQHPQKCLPCPACTQHCV